MKILLIYNPQAGHGRANKLLPEVEDTFQKHKVDFDLYCTQSAADATDLVAGADFAAYDGLVAAGGDGTLFAVINGYFKNKSTNRIPLGVLPTGTGNAFCRDLDLHVSRWQEAVKIIAAAKPREVDVGYFRTDGREYYFLNILGVGFVADVTATAQRLKFLGNIAYTLGVFYRTLFLKSDRMVVTINGDSFKRDCTFIEISNTRYTADFLMAPAAKIDDGLLDVTIAVKLNRRKLLRSFPKIFTGEHIYLPEVETYQADHIKISCGETRVLTPDGELLGTTPVEIKCLSRAIEVFWK